MGHGGYGVLDGNRGGKGSWMGIRSSQHHRQLLKCPDVGGWGAGGMGSWMGHGGYGVLDGTWVYGVLDGKRGQSQHHGQLLEYPDVWGWRGYGVP